MAFLMLCLMALAPLASSSGTYQPPAVTSAPDAYAPYQTMQDGLFVLKVSLNKHGQIRHLDVLRDPGAMLGAVKNSLQSWKFSPALENGQLEAGNMTVVFVYRPANYGNAGAVPPKDFRPVVPQALAETRKGLSFAPIGIVSFDYPIYPANSIAWGSVVVQLTVLPSGEMQGIGFLHRMKGFDDFVLDALKEWRFQAATVEGKPVPSKTAIAFIFQPPSSQ